MTPGKQNATAVSPKDKLGFRFFFFSNPVSRLSHLSIWLVLIPFYLQSYLYPILWNHTKSRITCVFTLLLLIIIIPAVSQWVQHMYSLIRDCPHLVLGYRHKRVLCSHFGYLIYDCVHSYSILPCQMPLWNNYELSSKNKAVDCTKLTKIVCTQGPSAHFCALVQGLDLILRHRHRAWILMWVPEKKLCSH